MECAFIRKNLFAIAEKQLPAEELVRVETHLETCGECSEMVGFFHLLEMGIGSVKKAEPDPFISTRTLAKLDSRFPEAGRTGRFQARLVLQPALISLFIALAIFAGILSGRYGYMRHDQSATVSETEMLKSELAIDELASEESGLLMME